MADCPYARCIQERKHIRRELLRWTKNMVFVVGDILFFSVSLSNSTTNIAAASGVLHYEPRLVKKRLFVVTHRRRRHDTTRHASPSSVGFALAVAQISNRRRSRTARAV
uniref:Uncharacterized protein n=1 Tax=Trichogramma kaykai TaxID=54128 RepID=A0ABD2VRS9_9HYME